MRKTLFAIEEYYHIYNRGVDKREVFMDKNDYDRFLLVMNLLNNEATSTMQNWKDKLKLKHPPKAQPWVKNEDRLVNIIAYCLNPNHYHFILQQVVDRGVEKFMHKLGTSYTMYFNKKYDRSGALFQGRFKSIHINSNEYLLHLSAYVNKNYDIHKYEKKDWTYSSLSEYVGKRKDALCDKQIIMEQFNNNTAEYKKFVDNSASYFSNKKKARKYIIE